MRSDPRLIATGKEYLAEKILALELSDAVSDLAQNEFRNYMYVGGLPQARDIRRVIELLLDARVLLACVHSDGNSVPLAGESDTIIQKLYFFDVGLANCLLRTDLDTIDAEMKNHFNTKGMIAEQFVAQHLAYLNGPSLPPELYYWRRDKAVVRVFFKTPYSA